MDGKSSKDYIGKERERMNQQLIYGRHVQQTRFSIMRLASDRINHLMSSLRSEVILQRWLKEVADCSDERQICQRLKEDGDSIRISP